MKQMESLKDGMVERMTQMTMDVCGTSNETLQAVHQELTAKLGPDHFHRDEKEILAAISNAEVRSEMELCMEKMKEHMTSGGGELMHTVESMMKPAMELLGNFHIEGLGLPNEADFAQMLE